MRLVGPDGCIAEVVVDVTVIQTVLRTAKYPAGYFMGPIYTSSFFWQETK